MVEGFLSKDHEPLNVQVDLVESETEAREGGGGSPSLSCIPRDGEADFERTEAEMALDAARERITGLEAELETAAQRNTDLVEEVMEAELERAARHNAYFKE